MCHSNYKRYNVQIVEYLFILIDFYNILYLLNW